MEEEAILEGPIEDGTILHILHSLTSRDYFDGLLEITSSGTTAKIWLKKGQVLAAFGFGLFDEEAVQAILLCRTGDYAFRKTLALPPARIEKNTVDLLLECLAKVDAEHGTTMVRAYRAALKQSASKFRVGATTLDPEPAPTEPLVTEESHPGFEEVTAPSAEDEDQAGAEAGDEASPDEEPPAPDDELEAEERAPEELADIKYYPKRKKGRQRGAKSAPDAEPEDAKAGKQPHVVPRGPSRSENRMRVRVPVLVIVTVVEAVVLAWALSPIRRMQIEGKLAQKANQEFDMQDAHLQRINEIIQRGDGLRDAGNLKEALTCYKDAKTLAPDDRRIDTILAQTREAIKRLQDAAIAARRASEHAQKAQLFSTQVNALIEAGDQDERRGDLDGALSRYREAQELSPDNRGISSLIANVRARIKDLRDDAARAVADRRQTEEVLQRVQELISAGNAKRQAGALEGALSDYLDALVFNPGNEAVRREMLAVRKEIEARGAPESSKNTWVVNIRVRSTTVQSVALDEGRAVDIQLSARGGLLKIGQINPFGKATAVYYENPHPRSLGEASFDLLGDGHKVRWQLMDIKSGVHFYRVTIKKTRSS